MHSVRVPTCAGGCRSVPLQPSEHVVVGAAGFGRHRVLPARRVTATLHVLWLAVHMAWEAY